MLNSSVTAAENKKVVAWTTFREFVVGGGNRTTETNQKVTTTFSFIGTFIDTSKS
jgi:hypothetical protein